MTARFALPEIDDLSDGCLRVPGPEAIPRELHEEVWIAPPDAELARRRYDVSNDLARAESVGRFGDADCLFFGAPDGEGGVFHPCPWGEGVSEEAMPGIAGALAIMLRDHAGRVGAIALCEGVSSPHRFGFVTFGGIDGPEARAAALCTAYVAAGWLPPSELALTAAQSGPLSDDTPAVVKAAVRIALDDLNERIGTALRNAAEETWRPSV